MKQLRPDLFAIRGWMGLVHLLVSPGELVLMDAGFIGDFRRVKRAVAALERQPSDLKAILLTHGHLDHTLNVARLQEWSGARIYAPAADEPHIRGCFPYRGSARVCGWLEACGRALFRYRPPQVDVWLREGDQLPFWGGLRVVSLPGHTGGHVGFLCETKRVCFVGDAFAYSWRIALPPPFLSVDHALVRQSLCKAAELDVDCFVPAHYFWFDDSAPARVRERARQLLSVEERSRKGVSHG